MNPSPPPPPAPPPSAPPPPREPLPRFDDQDVEAGARMVASENPSAGPDVWVEQLWTQIRALRPGQSLYARITGGHGYGEQGSVRDASGKKIGARPVATTRDASEKHRQLVREVLSGARPSQLPGARKYFDPEQQDAVFRQIQKGKADQKAGRPISARTAQLIALGYELDANGVRAKWTKDGTKKVGAIGPVEFWT